MPLDDIALPGFDDGLGVHFPMMNGDTPTVRFESAGLASRTAAVFGSIANYAFLPECLSLFTVEAS
jgi:hypothetical protein